MTDRLHRAQYSAVPAVPLLLRRGMEDRAMPSPGLADAASKSAWKTNPPANSLIKFQLTSGAEIDSDIRHPLAACLSSARSAQSRLSSAHLAALVFTFLMFY